MQSNASEPPTQTRPAASDQHISNQSQALQQEETQVSISNQLNSVVNAQEQNSQTEIPRIHASGPSPPNRPNFQQMKPPSSFNFNSTLNPSPLPKQQPIPPRKTSTGPTGFNGTVPFQQFSMRDIPGRDPRAAEMPSSGLPSPPLRQDPHSPSPRATHGITPALGYPIKVGFGGSPNSVELDGWNVPASGCIVVTGTIHGIPTVGVSGSALTPQLIATSLNRLVQVAPELIPQIQMIPRSTSDILPTALRLKNAILTRKQEVIQLVKARMNEVLQAPNQENIVQITNLLLALEAMTLPNERAAEIEKHIDALTAAAHEVFGSERMQTIMSGTLDTMAPTATQRPGYVPLAKKMATPVPKRRKLDDDKHVPVSEQGSPSQEMMYSTSTMAAEPRFDKKTRDAIITRTSAAVEFISTDLANVLIHLPPQNATGMNLIEKSILAALGNPTLRKLFYIYSEELEATSNGGESRTAVLRLRADLTVSQGRRIALEVCLPDTASSKTWYCEVIGAYMYKPPKEQPQQRLTRRTAIQIQEGGLQIESDLAQLDQATAGRVDWAAVFGSRLALNEANLMSDLLLDAAAALPGLPDEPAVNLNSLKELGPMRLLRLVRQNVVVNLTMTDQDRSNGNAELLPSHPIGETRGYMISPSGASEDGRIEFGHIEKLAAAWSSRTEFIRLLGAAIRNQPHRLQNVTAVPGAAQDDFSSTNVPIHSNVKKE